MFETLICIAAFMSGIWFSIALDLTISQRERLRDKFGCDAVPSEMFDTHAWRVMTFQSWRELYPAAK